MERKYFGTDGIRGHVGQGPINAEFVLKLGWAVGKILNRSGRSTVIVGKDTRVSGYMFEAALEAGLVASGCDTRLVGPMPTPAVAYLTRTLRASCGIVISASHNPYHDNGIKFFSSEGHKLSDVLELDIEKKIDEPFSTVDSADMGKAQRIDDAAGRYIEFCKSAYPNLMSLKSLKIVVDCANGATYHVAPNVFHELGAEVIAIHNEPNGFNINDHCGATYPHILQEAVLKHGADVGIALDGDGDRVVMVDENGDVCDGDDIIYIIAKRRKKRGKLQGGVVGTLMSNYGLELAIKELGLDFVRTPVGDRYVVDELNKRGWGLGGEPSGHIVCHHVTTTGDGIISALQVLAAMRLEEKKLSQLREGFEKYPQVMINVKLPRRMDVMNHPILKQAILDVQAALKGHGRVVIRPSGTEALVRVMVEGRDLQQVNALAKQLSHVVEQLVLG